MIDRFISWLYTHRIYGRRCPDYNMDCATCIAWRAHDEMFNEASDV